MRYCIVQILNVLSLFLTNSLANKNLDILTGCTENVLCLEMHYLHQHCEICFWCQFQSVTDVFFSYDFPLCCLFSLFNWQHQFIFFRILANYLNFRLCTYVCVCLCAIANECSRAHTHPAVQEAAV